MKRFEVVIGPTALREISEIYTYIDLESTQNAERWMTGVLAAIDSLEVMPTRCGDAREAKTLKEPLRQLIYKSHRIIFRIDEARAVVGVVHVRHAARRAIGEVPGGE